MNPKIEPYYNDIPAEPSLYRKKGFWQTVIPTKAEFKKNIKQNFNQISSDMVRFLLGFGKYLHDREKELWERQKLEEIRIFILK